MCRGECKESLVHMYGRECCWAPGGGSSSRVCSSGTECPDVLYGWELTPYDALCHFHYPTLSPAVEGGEAAVRGSDAAGQDALDGAPIEVGEDLRVRAKFLQPPEEEQSIKFICRELFA